MAIKRMRIFVGPNGLEKTSIFKGLLSEEKIQPRIYVSADDIRRELQKSRGSSFTNYCLISSDKEFATFFRTSYFSPEKRNEPDLWNKLRVEENILIVDTTIDSYLATDIAEYIRL